MHNALLTTISALAQNAYDVGGEMGINKRFLDILSSQLAPVLLIITAWKERGGGREREAGSHFDLRLFMQNNPPPPPN